MKKKILIFFAIFILGKNAFSDVVFRCQGSYGDEVDFHIILNKTGVGNLNIRYRDQKASCRLFANKVENLHKKASLELFDIILLRSNICEKKMTQELHHGVKQKILITIPSRKNSDIKLLILEGLGVINCKKFNYDKKKLNDLSEVLSFPHKPRLPERGPPRPLF